MCTAYVYFRSLLTQVDGLLQRHGQMLLLLQAAATLVYASRAGPAALQVGCCRGAVRKLDILILLFCSVMFLVQANVSSTSLPDVSPPPLPGPIFPIAAKPQFHRATQYGGRGVFS